MATSAAAVKEEPATKFAKDQLKAIIERIERLEEEKKTISDDIRDVYAEAKGNGFDVKTLALNTPDYLPEVHYHQVRDAWHGLRTPSGQ